MGRMACNRRASDVEAGTAIDLLLPTLSVNQGGMLSTLVATTHRWCVTEIVPRSHNGRMGQPIRGMAGRDAP